MLQILPSTLQLIFIWHVPSVSHKEKPYFQYLFRFRFVPESPRWLISKDRSEEAFEILVKYHAEGRRDGPFVLAEYAQIRDTIRMEIEGTRTKWYELPRTGPNRRRVFIAAYVGLFSQWSGSGLVSEAPLGNVGYPC